MVGLRRGEEKGVAADGDMEEEREGGDADGEEDKGNSFDGDGGDDVGAGSDLESEDGWQGE
jgi:hypothetical protein